MDKLLWTLAAFAPILVTLFMIAEEDETPQAWFEVEDVDYGEQ